MITGSRKLKDRRNNDQQKEGKRSNNDVQIQHKKLNVEHKKLEG